MASRLMVRRQKSVQRPVYHPQVIRLEERLPLGDALIGPLLAASWLGANLGSSWDAENRSVLKDPSISRSSGESETGESLWAGVLVSSGTAEQITLAAPGRVRPSFSAENMGEIGTAAPVSIVRGGLDLPERMVSSPEMSGVGAGMERNWGTSFYGRYGQSDHVGQLQALASVRLRGEGQPGARSAAPVGKVQIQQNYGKMALSFEANVGQADPAVHFLAHGPGYGLYLKSTEAVMVLQQGLGARGQGLGMGDGTAIPTRSVGEDPASLTASAQAATTAAVVRMQVLGGNPTAAVVGEDPLPGRVNYFLGNDPAQWHTNIATYAKVEYQQVYPGINLDYYGSGQGLEYDFVVAPGADPGQIRLGFVGADGVAVNAQGDLVVHAAGQDIVQHKPVVYQQVNGNRQEIASVFVVQDKSSGDTLAPREIPVLTQPGSPAETQEVGFRLGIYDASQPLVIDPVLSYSTYLGGSGADGGFGIAVDPTTGDALVTGWTTSTDFPTANPLQPNLGGGGDAFVARLRADGSALVYSTYLGGTGDDYGYGIAVDPATGDALVTGWTQSTNFPTANPLQPTYGGGYYNAFVARLRADGSALVFSTYLGGSGVDRGLGIAVDPTTGDVLVTGDTGSTDFPTANPLQPNFGGGDDVFVARLRADGSALVYSTYLGGTGDDYGYGIAVDPATGDALVTGLTESTNFPTANPLQPTNHGVEDAFVARLSANGSALVYSTYLGGSDNDEGTSIAVDPTTGDALVTGVTYSTNFPTANPLQPTYGGGYFDAFVARIS